MAHAATAWIVCYASDVVQHDIPALAHSVKIRIRKVIETKLTTDPLRFGKPLRYSLYNLRSLRVGDYRILYQVDHKRLLVSITAIGHRRDIYKA
jgi:mRNA interferase RelE/StbE